MQVDIKMVFRLMFGGGQFDDVFGDVCELPMLKQMLSQMEGHMRGQSQIEDERMHSYERQLKLKQEEEVYCKQLATKLLAKLNQRGVQGERAFGEQCNKDAMELCEAPGGAELVVMVGYVYCQEGKQYGGRFLGFEGFFAQIQEKTHVASSGMSVLMDAVKTANMAQEVSDENRARGVRDEQKQRELEAKMMRSGLNVVWKMGKLLLEERVRRVCEIMMTAVDADRSKVERLAHALIQVCSCCLQDGVSPSFRRVPGCADKDFRF